MLAEKFYQWVAIMIANLVGFFNIYLNLRKKAKLSINAKAIEFDHEKGLNTAIHPVNELLISIVNRSTCPLTIKNVDFKYHGKKSSWILRIKDFLIKNYKKASEAQFVYDNFSYKKRKQVIGKTLMKSEELSFALSCLDSWEKTVIDNLEKITIVSTYGHKYKLNCKKLRSAIKKVKEFKPPDPDNANLNFEKK